MTLVDGGQEKGYEALLQSSANLNSPRLKVILCDQLRPCQTTSPSHNRVLVYSCGDHLGTNLENLDHLDCLGPLLLLYPLIPYSHLYLVLPQSSLTKLSFPC